MADLKTKQTTASPVAFIKTIDNEAKCKDALALLALFQKVTGEKAKMWGTSIVGFGKYHYESKKSAQKGDWPLTGFSPRKQNLTLYVMLGFKDYAVLLKDLGKFKKSSGSCLYIKRLSDIDTKVLAKLIKLSVADMKKRYPTK